MRKLSVFNSVSLDGYFIDAKGDMSWAHKDPSDAEWNAFVSGNAQGGGALVFGRVTFQMMEAFWPTPMAMQMLPEVAKGMNAMQKFVFSRTLKDVKWQNSTILRGNPADAIRRLKSEAGGHLAILGSGKVVAQLSQAGLIDTYQFAVNPVVLGSGRTMFEGLDHRVQLRRTEARPFANGTVVLSYELAG